MAKMFVQSVINAQTGTTVSFVSAENAKKAFLLYVISIFIQQGNISFRDDFFHKTKRLGASDRETHVRIMKVGRAGFRIFGGSMGCRKHRNPG